MRCNVCNNEVKEGALFCTNCGAKIQNNVQQNYNVQQNNVQQNYNVNYTESEGSKFGWGVLGFFFPLVGLILFLVWKSDKKKASKAAGLGALIGFCISIVLSIILAILPIFVKLANDKKEPNWTINDNIDIKDEDDDNDSDESLDEAFEFNDLELTVGSDYEITTVNKSYSSYNGKEVVKLPITVKNLSDEDNHLNMFYYTVIGPNDERVSTAVSIYFDDACDYAGDLESGESYDKYLYFIYDGDGEYKIEFDNYSEEKTIELEIEK